MDAPLVFYDISSPLQPRSYAPNPSKSRYALGFKGVPFHTEWVDLPDIADVRRGLGCPPVRKFADGADFFTLPMLRDPRSGRVVGDSFLIAEWLDDNFPATPASDGGGGGGGDGGEGTTTTAAAATTAAEAARRPSLFPPDATGTGLDYESPHKDTPFLVPLTEGVGSRGRSAYANFNVQVDATFTAHALLVAQRLPLNPASAQRVREAFVERARAGSWDDFRLEGDAREAAMRAFEASLETLARPLLERPEGPFFEGGRATYADMIVGGWLVMFQAALPEEEWRRVAGWHQGAFGRLHDALQERYFVCI